MTPELRAAFDVVVAAGGSFGEMVNYFAEQDDQVALRHYIDEAQNHQLVSDGTLEVADPGCVSKGDDNGAYVMAWLWVEDDEIEETEEDK